MSELLILKSLVAAGMTVEAACAMAGNMMAESRMKPNNMQDSYEKALGFNDITYTAAVDNGSYSRERFISDDVGYGLYQLTLQSRKANYYDFAKARGKSIGDEQTQVEFCIEELKIDFPALWAYLCETHDGYVATERICREFERPAMNNIEARYKYAVELYRKYADTLAAGTTAGAEPPPYGAEIDREPASYILTEVTNGRTPEAKYLAALLEKIGYDVLWYGLENCVKDFQQKTGLDVDGICAEKTWRELLK